MKNIRTMSEKELVETLKHSAETYGVRVTSCFFWRSTRSTLIIYHRNGLDFNCDDFSVDLYKKLTGDKDYELYDSIDEHSFPYVRIKIVAEEVMYSELPTFSILGPTFKCYCKEGAWVEL